MKGTNFAGNMREFYYNPAAPEDPNEGITEEQREQLRLIKKLIPS